MEEVIYFGGDHPQAGQVKETKTLPDVPAPTVQQPTKAELLAKVEEILAAIEAMP